MHAAVLADLEVGEVEAEGLHLPDEPVQLPVCRASGRRLAPARPGGFGGHPAARPVARRRSRDPPGGWQRFDRQPSAGTAGTARPGERASMAAPRPPRISCAERSLLRKAWSGGVVSASAVRPDADPGGRSLEAAQDVLRLNEHRLAGDLGSDLRIAVAVAPDPAPEAKKRRRGRPVRAGLIRVERCAELAVDRRHEPEEGLVEDAHERTDLVERLQVLTAELSRTPEPVDLLEQPAPDLGLRRLGEPGIGRAVRAARRCDGVPRSRHAVVPRWGGR